MTSTIEAAPDATPPIQVHSMAEVSIGADDLYVVTGPLLRPVMCVCGQPKSEHAGKSYGGRCATSGCRRMRLTKESRTLLAAARTVDRTLGQDLRQADSNRQRARTKAKRKHGRLSVGPSDTSSCRRSIQYREAPPEDLTTNPVDKRAALMGTLIHEGVARLRKRRYPWRLYEHVIHVPGLDTPGKCDEFDPVLGIVFDLKTAGDWKWEAISEDGPPLAEWEQVMLYAFGLIAAGHFVREVRIIYVQRANGKDEVYVRPYDEALALAALDRLTATLEALDAGIDLPRDREGPTLSPLCRSYCAFRDYCWNITDADKAERSPESWTMVHDDADVEYHLAEYDRGRKMATEGTKIKDKSKALLQGIPEGHYGNWFYGHTGDKIGEPKDSVTGRVEQLERFYELPEDERPDLKDLPYPQVRKRSPWAIKVKAERFAAAERRRFASAMDPTPVPVDLVHKGRT